MNKHCNQQGFIGVVIAYAVLILAALGVVSWYVLKMQPSAHKALPPVPVQSNPGDSAENLTQTATDKSGVFLIKYPADWTATAAAYAGTDYAAAPLGTAYLTIAPNNGSLYSAHQAQKNGLTVQSFKTSDAKVLFQHYAMDASTERPSSIMIHGYPALYWQDESKAMVAGDLTYTQDNYVVTHNGTSVVLFYREKQGSDSSGSLAFDDSRYLPTVNAIVKSLTFTN